ncbi:unnamed protein product [Rotaria socialis]|nr:unnamed protein product [Rotaria socialis]CAF3331316.1 unnamed protein product [Rotaria socialis]CAF3480161.1 unnamed protein product [Rotaria socialis]CAF4533084.1 unnamed protein product [Rotaria socialis]CAF4615013.1 unnamed protein product [Rotaria socialis]
MNKFEQKVVLNDSLEDTNKIFQNRSITCIEDFSNEIFFEIFDYFNGYEIVETFSTLNSQFDKLLHSSSFLIKTHFFLFHYPEKIINTFNQLEIFSNKTYPNLKILSISFSKNINFLDAHRWERIILSYYPQLEKFYLNYYECINNGNQHPINCGEINEFSSSFWIERKWIFYVEIKFMNIEYKIRPYNKKWYHDTNNNIINYSTNLTLTFIYDSILKDIELTLTVTKIYHLEIFDKEISISILVQILNRLSQIITLKIHSLSTDKRAEVTVEQLNMLCLMKSTSKIAKVYVEHIDDVKQINFIFTICPRMKYFQVGLKHSIDFKFFLGNIFNNIKHNNYQLDALCLHIPTTGDEILEDVNEKIKYENLPGHVTIKRVLDHVYLKWT